MEISEEAAWMSKRGGDDERKEDEVAISIFLLLFCSLLIVLGPINLSGTNTCRKQSRGSHVTFTSGNLWLFFFVSPRTEAMEMKKATVESFIRIRFFCACHDENLHLHLRFPPFSPSHLKTVENYNILLCRVICALWFLI